MTFLKHKNKIEIEKKKETLVLKNKISTRFSHIKQKYCLFTKIKQIKTATLMKQSVFVCFNSIFQFVVQDNLPPPLPLPLAVVPLPVGLPER